MGCIYKISNTLNNKVYIGLTTNTAEIRFKKHISMINSNGCSALYSAFKKYGVENFKVEEVVKSNNKEALMELESFYIDKYNTLSPNGYNLTTGGENCKVSSETKEKISNSLKGRKITWADKVSIGVKKLWEDKEYREKQTKQRKKKRGKYRDGIIKPLRLDLPSEKINKMYKEGKTINEISKILGVSFYTIKKRIKIEE